MNIFKYNGILYRYNRKFDNIFYYGCNIRKTNEFFEIQRIESHVGWGKDTRDHYSDFVISVTADDRLWYNSYREKVSDAEYHKYINESEFRDFKDKSDVLRKRKGTYEFIYYDNFKYRDDDFKSINFVDSESCSYSCRKLNMHDSYYSSIEKSVKDDWVVLSSSEKIFYRTDKHCVCSGAKYIMKK